MAPIIDATLLTRIGLMSGIAGSTLVALDLIFPGAMLSSINSNVLLLFRPASEAFSKRYFIADIIAIVALPVLTFVSVPFLIPILRTIPFMETQQEYRFYAAALIIAGYSILETFFAPQWYIKIKSTLNVHVKVRSNPLIIIYVPIIYTFRLLFLLLLSIVFIFIFSPFAFLLRLSSFICRRTKSDQPVRLAGFFLLLTGFGFQFVATWF